MTSRVLLNALCVRIGAALTFKGPRRAVLAVGAGGGALRPGGVELDLQTLLLGQ